MPALAALPPSPPVAPVAAAAAVQTATSSNWSGYAVGRRGRTFRSVTGRWTVPAVTCPPDGRLRLSAAWVGLGGLRADSQAVEQTGTESDCAKDGRATYGAWFEVVPAPSVTARLEVRPGDRMQGSVRVTGRLVRLRIADLTSGEDDTLTLRVPRVDVSSAEWIVEAPALCRGGRRVTCQQKPLAPFGSLAFEGAQATSSAGTSGAIEHPAWDALQIRLEGEAWAGPLTAPGAFGVTYGVPPAG
jgi:hypothetical protein